MFLSCKISGLAVYSLVVDSSVVRRNRVGYPNRAISYREQLVSSWGLLKKCFCQQQLLTPLQADTPLQPYGQSR